MKKIILLTFIFSNFVFSKDVIVADVGGIKITKMELEREYKQRLLYPSHKKITMQSVLDELVNKKVGIIQARKEKLDQEEFVQDRFNDILHNALISRDLTDKFSAIKVSDKEVKDYYKKNKEYKTSHILYRIRAVPSKKEMEEGLKIIAQISKTLKKEPFKFEELAKKHSQVASNKSAGDIGFLPSTSMSPEYFAAINGKELGHITEPVRTQFGFHIIKVTGVKKFEDIDKKLYKKIIFDIKRDKILSDYYARLKKSAKVKVYKNRL